MNTEHSLIGTPGTPSATRIVLLGSGELGREVAIEAARLGCEVVACDRYEGAPAMAVAHRSRVLAMTDAEQLRAALNDERDNPCARLIVVPEIEAIATQVLEEFENEGVTVVPTARAAQLTIDREGIRRLAAEELQLPTSPYRFCDSEDELRAAANQLGFPCVIKPIMSSSGKGQSVAKTADDIAESWVISQESGRTGATRIICEAFVEFDYELTLLTVRHSGGTSFCAPIGHRQEGGDYRESWQPASAPELVIERARDVATKVTDALGGHGIFGVELFVKGDDVIFSEVSPRPHDTGLVTLASQQLSEFALHVRAILGLTVPREIELTTPAASAVLLAQDELARPQFFGIDNALAVHQTVEVKLFGKPDARPGRRMGVVVATADSADAARTHASAAAMRIRVHESP
jgi:phosphoribosylglycinamide formyltransferase 2